MMRKLVIIGYGAAGFAALIRANELGIKPVLIGYGPLGGVLALMLAVYPLKPFYALGGSCIIT